MWSLENLGARLAALPRPDDASWATPQRIPGDRRRQPGQGHRCLAAHLALGPAPGPPLSPAYPGAGHVYRLRKVARKGSGLPRARPRSRPALLVHCRQRHRPRGRRAAGTALRLPPWPPPPLLAPAPDPAAALAAVAAVTEATAAAAAVATGSPARMRAARPIHPRNPGPAPIRAPDRPIATLRVTG